MVQVALPAVTDGTTPTTGTPFDKAFRDGCASAIDDVCHSATNPGEAVKDIIDETVEARGNMPSVGARLDVVVTADGAPISELSGAMVRNGFVHGNYLANDTFKQWSRGDAAAPDSWELSGAGAAIERCGPGQSDDVSLPGMDDWAAKLTYGSAPAVLAQKIITTAMLARMGDGMLSRYTPRDGSNAGQPGYSDDEANLKYYALAHVRSTAGGIARIRLTDGVASADSPYHDGNTSLYIFKSLIAGPLQWQGGELQMQCRVEAAGSAHFQLASVTATPLGLPPMYLPGLWRFGSWVAPTIATPTAATGYGYFIPTRPVQLVGLSAYAAGAVPTGGTTLKLDVMVPIGGTFVSVFQTLLEFTASDRHAYANFDPAAANYRRLTVRPQLAAKTAIADNSMARIDVNTRDSGNTGANIVVTLHYLEQILPFDNFRSAADLAAA